MISNLWSGFVTLFNSNSVLVAFIWTVSWAVVSFILGTWFGHYLARKRDKRKEFNLVSDPMEIALRKDLRQLADGNDHIISDPDFYTLSIHLTKSQQRAYQQAIARYFEALYREPTKTPSGCIVYNRSIPELIFATEQLLTFVKHR
ncbi:hypothetical protein ACF1CY_003906 [Providencia rettgeri]